MLGWVPKFFRFLIMKASINGSHFPPHLAEEIHLCKKWSFIYVNSVIQGQKDVKILQNIEIDDRDDRTDRTDIIDRDNRDNRDDRHYRDYKS